MRRALSTGGERVSFEVEPRWVAHLLERSAGALLGANDGAVTMEIVVERSRAPFPTPRWETIGRAVARSGTDVVLRNVARSGFDLLVRGGRSVPLFVFRWRPGIDARALHAAPALFRLRVRAALMLYPVLWRAATAGRAPLHAACVRTAGGTALVVGTPGAGKSTVLAAEATAGHDAVSDNLCVGDPRTIWGLIEPVRLARDAIVEHRRGARTTHGRLEYPPAPRPVLAQPDIVVVLRRGPRSEVRDASDGAAARLLVTSTYASGELRRFWPLAATLSMATGLGPAIPPVADVARALTHRLPCVEVTLARPGVTISEVLSEHGRSSAGRPASLGVAG